MERIYKLTLLVNTSAQYVWSNHCQSRSVTCLDEFLPHHFITQHTLIQRDTFWELGDGGWEGWETIPHTHCSPTRIYWGWSEHLERARRAEESRGGLSDPCGTRVNPSCSLPSSAAYLLFLTKGGFTALAMLQYLIYCSRYVWVDFPEKVENISERSPYICTYNNDKVIKKYHYYTTTTKNNNGN